MISKAKQRLLKAMGKMYPKVQIIYFFKVLQSDGSILRDGFAANNIWDFKDAASSIGMDLLYWKAEAKFVPVFRERLGRDPLPGEIRVAFRPQLDTFGVVFVDDVIRTTPANILIETSPENWQAHFMLSRVVGYKDAARIQKHLIMTCTGTNRMHGDLGAASPVQPRRFPEGRFIYDECRKLLDVDAILSSLLAAEELQRSEKAQNRSILRQSCENNWTQVALEQVYIRFNSKNSDLSAVDMAFSIYLLSLGLSEEFVSEALESVSPNVKIRHPSINDYLLRTISKATQQI